MRLRNVRGARDVLERSPYVIKNPGELKGGWKEEFGRSGPLHIEIGMGKGRFLLEMAEKNPQISYVGVELYASVLVRAAQKLEGRELPNLRLLNMPAEYLEDVFGPEEVDRIYLNFFRSLAQGEACEAPPHLGTVPCQIRGFSFPIQGSWNLRPITGSFLSSPWSR